MTESPRSRAAVEEQPFRTTVDEQPPGGPDETILLPVGPDDDRRIDRLAHTAAETAGMLQTTVTVLHVITHQRTDGTGDDVEAPSSQELVERVDPVQDLMAALETPLRNWGTTMTVEARVGASVSAEIVAAAAERDAKRIIVGGRRRTPAGKAIFGSTAQEILLDAPCPVTFVRDADPL